MDRDIIVKETLPHPYAHYCDTFIGFHRDLATDLTFCACQVGAVANHLTMCALYAETQKAGQKLPWYINAYADYPRSLVRLATSLTSEPHKVLKRCMTFAPGLCHRCNRMPLSCEYGFSDVPSNYFITHFRPYVNQQFYAYGLSTSGHIVLPEKCPDSIKVVDEDQRRVLVENIVRDAFSFPKRGVNRNRESMLFLRMRAILPGAKVMHNYRPAWLEGLELDIFVEDFNLGIEYQGVQHSEPMDHLGGEKAFKAVRRRDKKKAALCKAHGITLLEVGHEKEVSDSTIRFALRKHLPAVQIISPIRIESPPFDFHIESCGYVARWTNSADRGDLSISIKSPSCEYFISGTDYSIAVSHRGGIVTGIDIWMQRSAGTASVTMPIAESDQVVKMGHATRPIMDLFKLWATFDRNIGFTDAEGGVVQLDVKSAASSPSEAPADM